MFQKNNLKIKENKTYNDIYFVYIGRVRCCQRPVKLIIL